jgi:hypothetical protein
MRARQIQLSGFVVHLPIVVSATEGQNREKIPVKSVQSGYSLLLVHGHLRRADVRKRDFGLCGEYVARRNAKSRHMFT